VTHPSGSPTSARSRRSKAGHEGLVYTADDEGEGWSDLAFAADLNWEQERPSSDVPWEVTSDTYGDSFVVRF
jgi:hypothetical protein